MKKMAFLLALTAVPLQAGLKTEIAGASGWIGYQVPVHADGHTICSYEEWQWMGHGPGKKPSTALLVMMRVAAGEVREIRISSPECNQRHNVRWLQNIDPQESIAVLLSLIDDRRAVSNQAITALAVQKGGEEHLLRLARRHPSSNVRGKALFWVGQRAGKRAAATLAEAVDHDPDEEVREKAVFGISQLPDEQSVPMLIKLLNTHRNRDVRKKAAFWLSQKDDPRALAAFEEILSRP